MIAERSLEQTVAKLVAPNTQSTIRYRWCIHVVSQDSAPGYLSHLQLGDTSRCWKPVSAGSKCHAISLDTHQTPRCPRENREQISKAEPSRMKLLEAKCRKSLQVGSKLWWPWKLFQRAHSRWYTAVFVCGLCPKSIACLQLKRNHFNLIPIQRIENLKR